MMQPIESAFNAAADAAEAIGESGTRRALLGTAFVAGLAALTTKAEAQSTGGIHPAQNWRRGHHRLIRRLSYGPTIQDKAELDALELTRWSEPRIFDQIDDSEMDRQIAEKYPRLSMSAPQLGFFADDWMTSVHLGEATIMRAAFGRNQIKERMVEFWTDHFSVHVDKTGGYTAAPFFRDVIRKHALGNFRDLLRAVAQSPAMLIFLDNIENYGDFGNVNYARELMELHTMGVNGGYTQEDVRNVARCFSGWSLVWNPGAPDHGQFAFYDWAHSTLEKRVLGQTIPAGGGKSDGDRVLNILLAHPATARFISWKLARFLMGYEPPEALVARLADTYTRSFGSIRSMLRVLIHWDWLASAPPKYKRPFHLMVGALRQTNAKMVAEQWAIRYEHLYQAGHLPHFWQTPDGYPDQLDFWAGLLLPRWNFALMFTQGYVWNVNVDVRALLGSATTPDAIVNRIDRLLFVGEMLPEDRNDLLAFLRAAPIDDKRLQAAFALALASPSYQWY